MTSVRNLNGLTLKQQAFCDLYRGSEDDAIRGNAKQCYMLAYGANETSAEANGPRLLKDKHVFEYLITKREMAEEAVDISEERILRELSYSAFIDPGCFFNDEGALLPVHQMPEEARRALAGIEITTIGSKGEISFTSKIKHIDKKGVLELLMKHKKMLTDKVEHSGHVDGGVLVVPGDVASPEEWLQKHYQNQSKE